MSSIDNGWQGPTLGGEAPNPYVKLYLIPDPIKQTKRKTKIAHSTYHPTYNEMVRFIVLTILCKMKWYDYW